MVKLYPFVGTCILLILMMTNSSAFTYLDNGEEIANLSQNIELSDEEKAEIQEKQRSYIVLVGMAVSVFTIFCLTLLVGLYVAEKKREKNDKK